MKKALISALLLCATLPLFFSGSQAQERSQPRQRDTAERVQPVDDWQTFARKLQKMSEDLERLTQQVGELERRQLGAASTVEDIDLKLSRLLQRFRAEEPSTGGPTRPTRPTRPPRPGTQPPDTGGVPHAVVTYQLEGQQQVAIELAPSQWEQADGWVHRRERNLGGPLEVSAWWQSWEDAPNEYRLTIAVANAFPTDGFLAKRLRSLTIAAGASVLFTTGPMAMPPGWAKVERVEPATFDPWAWASAKAGVSWPAWSEAKAAALRQTKPVALGAYKIWWDMNTGAPSGEGIGPFYGGPNDWLTGPEGRRMRATSYLLESQKGPIWRLDPHTGEPLYLPTKVWNGRAGTGDPAHPNYIMQAPGFVWVPTTAEERALYDRRAADGYHGSRGYAPAVACAPWDNYAQFVVNLWWSDYRQNWPLRPDVPDAPLNRNLEMGFAQILRVTEPGQPLAYPSINSFGDRGAAHFLRLHAWSAPYRPAAEVAEYTEAIWKLITQISGPLGFTDHAWGQDMQKYEGAPFHMRTPGALAFQIQLMQFGLAECGRVFNDKRFIDQAQKLAVSMTPVPPYGFETRPVEGRIRTVYDGNRRHSAMERDPISGDLIPQSQKHYAFAGYGNFTHGILVDFPDPENMMHHATMRGVEADQPLDYTPRTIYEQLIE